MKTHKISWLNIPGYIPQTLNPIVGCSKVSEGCRNCYAERMAARLASMTSDHLKYDEVINCRDSWNGETLLVESALQKPLGWKKPRSIFVNSMGDLFHESTPDEWIDRVFAMMAACPQHLFILLTKRAKRMENYVAGLTTVEGALRFEGFTAGKWDGRRHKTALSYRRKIPLPNVWLGVTAENQAAADERIPHLLRTPAAVRFVSCEPMVGKIDFSTNLYRSHTIHLKMSIEGAIRNRAFKGFEENGVPVHPKQVEAMLRKRLADGEKYFPMCDCPDFDPQTGCQPKRNPRLDWVICGGESGPGARPMNPEWARSLRDQAKSAGVPFFFKQWGDWMSKSTAPLEHYQLDCRQVVAWRNGDKKHGGDILDGHQWHEFPEVVK
jgi:protein gp37